MFWDFMIFLSPTFSLHLISNLNFHSNEFFIKFSNILVLPDSEPPIIKIL